MRDPITSRDNWAMFWPVAARTSAHVELLDLWVVRASLTELLSRLELEATLMGMVDLARGETAMSFDGSVDAQRARVDRVMITIALALEVMGSMPLSNNEFWQRMLRSPARSYLIGPDSSVPGLSGDLDY